ncbi:class I SAM-dependent methyltransferase [Geomesophilobacter sediminis]|uniref:S-adenosyl-L-methionine-dependent methyltransferase n=1 Tax=Geomesophilobacter sediminis TaxID=2798584 RepID=A0A8J7M067_9BACT|nr:SAM-dependent methyltransferase [Geomesophilobacter sediminis]MBJ6723597.1 class I SAM-dependent methyltransferase [Geomesophilobacter sediminis]
MEENKSSKTAQMTAYFRWHHYRYDAPHIFADALAGAILSEGEKEEIEAMLFAALQQHNPAGAAKFADRKAAIAWMMQTGASTPVVLARARYAEEMLSGAIEAGASQYVILGAGLDTFAFRRPELLERLDVFDVDHPASQEHKRRRIRELGWRSHPNLHFVPVDFSRDRLGAKLRRSGFQAERQSFFSWLGVTYYLSAAEVRDTLREVAATASPGSALVFDYLDHGAYEREKASPRVVRMLSSVESIGEPMRSGFDGHALAGELDGCGLELQENLGPYDIHYRYFIGRTDYHRACEHVHFACATVRERSGRSR